MLLENKTVAVTGASGMIGVYICRSLLKAGAKVIGVVRTPSKAAFLAEEGVEFRQADLNDPASLQQAFKGCDAVVSNAAMYIASKSMGNWKAHEKANQEGTGNVMEAAHLNGIKRVIQISTFGVYKFSITRSINEQSPQINGAKRQGGPYRATKQTSEALAWEIAKTKDLDLTTLRPAGVYGARDNNLIRPMYKLLRLPLLLLPSISFPFVYAGDVANAVVGALENDSSIGEAYNVGGDIHQVSDVLGALISVLDKKPKLFSLPLPISIKVDNSKAERDIGFKNCPLEIAMEEIVGEETPPPYLCK
ncbi:MAG: epimerase [Moraxellaceae bacterium]|nr:MAG: epimerase [Moraxellaceae bacterium]